MPRKPQTAGNPDDTRRVGNEVLLGTPKSLGDDELVNGSTVSKTGWRKRPGPGTAWRNRSGGGGWMGL